jgi:uncharacterized protein (TIGR04255 family)
MAISIACKTPYAGWQNYQPEISSKIQSLLSIPSLVGSVDRVGLRYINFFAGFPSADDVFDTTMGCLRLAEYARRSFSVRTEFSKENVSVVLNAADNASNMGTLGSLVDLDVSSSKDLNPNAPFIVELVDVLHREEKAIFFGLLRKELVDKFKPEY